MAGINFIGSYSGMDQGVIDKLMAVEKRPLVTFASKKTGLEARQGAWKDVATRLKNLLDKLTSLTRSENLYGKTAVSSAEAAVSVSASRDAVPGKYEVTVHQLATQSKWTGAQMQEVNYDTPLGLSGSFTLGSGDKSATVRLEANQTLRSAVRSINLESANSGVTATVVDGKMVLSAVSFGPQSIVIQEAEEGAPVLTALGLSDTQSVSVPGQGSRFEVNGILMSRSGNTVNDAVLGLTLQLKQETGNGPATVLDVGDDLDKSVKAFQEFVDQYNSTASFLKTVTAAGTREVAGSQGKLYGESSLLRFQNTLRQTLTSDLTDSGSTLRNLSQLGIKTLDKEGTLVLDAEKLRNALRENPNQVQRFLTGASGTEGMATKLEGLVKGLTDTTGGMIKIKTASLERSLKDLNRRISEFEDKMKKREAYYINMFSKLDVAMQKSEAQTNWLSAQLGGMSGRD